MRMRSIFITLSVAAFCIVSLTGVSNAVLPTLGYQGFGAPAQSVAARAGVTVDTVFVNAGFKVRIFEVSHASPVPPTELPAINFDLSGQNASFALHPSNSIILAGTMAELVIRNYRTGADLTVPPSLLGYGINDVIFNTTGDRAYISTNGGGIFVLDMTNPASASVLGNFADTESIFALAFKSGAVDTLFTAGQGFKGLKLYDVSTPASPTLLVQTSWGDSASMANRFFMDIAVISDTIYVAQSDSGYRTFPKAGIAGTQGTLTYINGGAFGLTPAKGDSFIFITSGDGIRTLGVNTSVFSGPASLPGASPGGCAPGWANLLYAAFGLEGFQIYNMANPTALSQLGGVGTGDVVFDVAADDRNIAYVAAGQVGVQLINLVSHTPIGGALSYSPAAHYKRVLVRKDVLYAFFDNGIDIVDVKNPSAPVLLSSFPGIGTINDAAFSDSTSGIDTLLAVADNLGIKLLNIKNPASLTVMNSLSIVGGGANHIQVPGRSVYAALQRGGIGAWDISNPMSPTLMDSAIAFMDSTNTFIRQFVKRGKSIHYIKGDSVGKIDASVPTNLVDMGTYYGSASIANGLHSIAMAGKFLHLGAGNGEIIVVDTTTEATADYLSDLLDIPNRLTINGLNLFVAAGADGYFHVGDNFGTARIRIPQMTGVTQDTVEARIKILDNLINLPSMSFESFFTFDTNYVQFVSLERGSILPSGDSLVTALTHSSLALHTDTLKIARADTGNIGLGTDSTLLKIKLRIKNNATVLPLLQYTTLNASHILIAEGTPAVDFGLGRINVVPRFGDANQNGMISPTDASLILQYIIGIMTAPPIHLADVSGNGETRAFDAALILRKLLFANYKFPVEILYNLKMAPVNKEAIVTLLTDASGVVAEDASDAESGAIFHNISLKNISQMLSAEMTIDLGPGQRFAGYELSPLAQGMVVEYRQEGNILHLVMAGGEPIEGEGEFIRLKCQVIDAEGLKPVEIIEFLLNESLVENIQGSASGMPRTFALGQNYPNPFNPVTTILYQLPNESNVTIRIYNILGQQVRVLVNAKQPAGYYSMKWDGRDEFGSPVASGVYFYRIQAGPFMKTKKMLFMK